MHPLARAHVHPRTHPTQCLPFPSCPIQQPHPNPSHPIPSHPICPSPPDPISISFSCARGGTRRARVTAHLIRSKQKICRPHDNPLLLVGPQPPRLLASQRHEAAAQFAALVIHRLCTHGHEADGRTSCRDTTATQSATFPIYSLPPCKWLAAKVPASSQLHHANCAVLHFFLLDPYFYRA